MKQTSVISAFLLTASAFAPMATAQTPPPAPTLLDPPNGAALVQPITLQWEAVVDPDGPIVSYTWEVSATSTFSSVIASGSNNLAHESIPVPTQGMLSGIPSGTYFWRVLARQNVGGESPWSAVRSLTVTGLGPAPGTPSITTPSSTAQFHILESFKLRWTAVAGAHYYILEADDEPSFSHPINLSTSHMEFGTEFGATWGNAITIYYRVRAVSVDNVRGLPSPTRIVQITNAAPVPPAPTPLSPVGGAAVSLPFTFDWSDAPNPQIPGYDLDVDDEPNFQGTFGVLFVSDISRSDYMLATDLAPGTYFWRVRALHGSAIGPWSAGASFQVVASPPPPPGFDLFWFITQPSTSYAGQSTQARVTLNMPAPAGGALVHIASDMPHAEVPDSVLIPAGATDAVVSPITTVPVGGATFGSLRAAYGGGWEQSSLGLWQILFSLSLNTDNIIGGNPVTGTVTLQRPAPAGGTVVTLISDDTAQCSPPATVLVPAGETAASFQIATAPVTVPTRIVINSGTADDGYRAPEAWLTLMPPGSPAAGPMLASVSLAAASILGGGSTTGTVTLTAPAPPGGALVWVNGSMQGQVVTPAGSVTVPAGSISADFPIVAPQVNATHWVLIQASYVSNGGMHGAVLEIAPGPPAPSPILTIGLVPMDAIGGNSVLGTVGLTTPAPPGGAVVTLTSQNPALAQVPASVNIAAGNSANSFTITTGSVITMTSVRIDGTAGGVTKSAFLTLREDPNAGAVLLDVQPSVGGTTGGNSIPASLFLNAAAPPGGAAVSLTSSNPAAAQVPATVTIPAGSGFASFTITTSPVAVDTSVTITGTYGVSQTATITVLAGPSNTGFLSPSANAADSGGDGNGFESTSAAAHTDDTLNAVDNNGGTASSTSCTSTSRDKHRFFNYGVNVPAGAAIQGIEVRLDARVDSTSGAPKMCVQLSWDGGATWTTTKSTPTLTTGMATHLLGGAADTWGRAWTSAELSNASFRVRVINVASSTNRDFSLDWVPVRVTYQGGASGPDTTSPTVSITTPASGATVSGTTTISATASDNVGVSGVEFYVDNVLLATDTAAPYSASWNTTLAANGAHALDALAFDAAGNEGLSTVINVTVSNIPPDTTPPTVSISAPAAGATVSATTTISATASDNVGVSRVEFLVDGVLLSSDTTSPYSASWNTTTATNGAHSLTARAFDAANNQTASAAVSVTVNNAPPSDTTPPTVSITAPAAGATVSGTVTISASATDNVGVTRVEFLVDGVILSSDTTSPYSASWNTTTATNGAHSLTARAFDAANNQTTSAAVSVTVNNGAPPVLDITLSGVPATIPRGQFFTATGTVANTGGSTATGYTVVISWTPSNSMRMESPQNSTQSLAPVAAGGSQGVSWQMRADNQANATITMTLRNSSGQTVDTVSQAITITN